VNEPGLYVLRKPRPIAIAIGVVRPYKRDSGHSGANAETFEGLVEYEDWIEDAELRTHSTEVEADNHGVEYDAEFKDQERGDLLSEGAFASCSVFLCV
jgi:hypothetical protein